ncbi:MAG TPA: VWA domain-containing protein [Candidatus Polarisedimenticolaceae bacterium]|nr:VWA domain-containing protein [Candidatus Polarisedimenticolaceae bacterium]
MKAGCLALTIALALTAPALSQDQPSSLKFVSPRRHQTLIGPSKVELAVTPPNGVAVMRVSLFVDNAPAGEKTSPPWVFTWDFGDGSKGHTLEATAAFADGTVIQTTVETSRLQVNETEEVALVNVYAIARDTGGKYVTDLKQEDFHIFENDRPQKLDRFSADRRPLRVAIVLDTSLSMEGEKLKSAVTAADEFLKIVQPGDEGLVIAFSDKVNILQDLTSNVGELEAAVKSVQAKGGTALYDAIVKASDRLSQFEGRRVMVVLSDGRDEADNGLEPGSLHTAEEAQERALRNEVMVFAIGVGKSIARDAKALDNNPTARAEELDFYGRKPLVTILRGFADATGGTSVFSPGAGQLRRSFEQVADDLRHQYMLAYTSDDPRHDGSWRGIKVTAARPGVTMTNRKGYYAPSDLPIPSRKKAGVGGQ